MTLSAFDLYSLRIASGIPANVIGEPSDNAYRAPQSDWLTADFHGWFFRALDAFGIREYTPESGDCDDYADLFCALARIAHRRTPEGKGTALPVGRLNFVQAAGGKHAIVWAATADRGLIFIEPQIIGRVLALTVPELNSATRCTD